MFSAYGFKRVVDSDKRGNPNGVKNFVNQFTQQGKDYLGFDFIAKGLETLTSKDIERLKAAFENRHNYNIVHYLKKNPVIDKNEGYELLHQLDISYKDLDVAEDLPIKEIAEYAENKTRNLLRKSGSELDANSFFIDFTTDIMSVIAPGKTSSIQIHTDREMYEKYTETQEMFLKRDIPEKYKINDESSEEERKMKAKLFVEDYAVWLEHSKNKESEEDILEFDNKMRLYSRASSELENQKQALEITDALMRTIHNQYKFIDDNCLDDFATAIKHPDSSRITKSATASDFFEVFISLMAEVRRRFPHYAEGSSSPFPELPDAFLKKIERVEALVPGALMSTKKIWNVGHSGEKLCSNEEEISKLRKNIRQAQLALTMIDAEEAINRFADEAEPKVSEITVGANWSVPENNFRFVALKDLDPRHFTVGDETDCCQILGGAGEDAAIDSFVNKYAGVLTLEVKVNDDWKLSHQSYFHWVPDGGYILDNIEENAAVARKIKALTGYTADQLYAMWAKHIKSSNPAVKYILLGHKYTTINMSNFSTKELKKDPRTFSDIIAKPYTDFDYRMAIDLLSSTNEREDHEAQGSDSNSEDDRSLYNEWQKFQVKNSYRGILYDLKSLVYTDTHMASHVQAVLYEKLGIHMKEFLIHLASTLGKDTRGWEKFTLNQVESRVFPTARSKAQRKAFARRQRFLKYAKYLSRSMYSFFSKS